MDVMPLLRSPVVAGQFYPRTAESCRAQIEACLADTAGRAVLPPGFGAIAGIVPHAGWVCSGSIAGEVIRVLAGDHPAETFVVFGAVHRRMEGPAAIYAEGAWETPLGQIPIDAA